MKIIDLAPDHESLYFQCLEDWSEEMKEAGQHKKLWFEKIRDQGLRVKLALNDRGEVGGMIQYVPSQFALIEGRDLYLVLCIWVHGHKQGRGNFQKRGMGQALLAAAERDAKDLGAQGLSAWGLMIPVWMKASWFKKHGFRKVDRMGLQSLLWKPFTPAASPPRWVRPVKKPAPTPGRVTVTAFINGWCPAQSIAIERARRAASEFGDSVLFREINTFDRSVLLEWGLSDAIFIDDKQVWTGPPPSLDKLRKMIAKKVAKL